MNKAMKFARKQLTKIGAVVEHQHDKRIDFRMPDGSAWMCTDRTSEGRVRELVRRWSDWDAASHGEYLSRFVRVVPMPSIAGLRLKRTSHFAARCDLMSGQGMRATEVRDALLRPTSVRATEHGTRLFCRGRIAVAVAVDDGIATAVTCLWTTNELWAQNPRKERDAYE